MPDLARTLTTPILYNTEKVLRKWQQIQSASVTSLAAPQLLEGSPRQFSQPLAQPPHWGWFLFSSWNKAKLSLVPSVAASLGGEINGFGALLNAILCKPASRTLRK